MASATCRWWDADEGWGVLVLDAVDGDVFAHFSCIVGDDYRELNPGASLEIEWESFPSRQDGSVTGRRASSEPAAASATCGSSEPDVAC